MLEIMTIDGARALRMEHDIGSIEPGKQADLVMIQVPSFYATADQVLSHLIHNSSPKDVMKTVIAGVETNPQELVAEVREIYEKFS
jgi:cytosine/adenosine deaminase-related metal-dependent hydrolase